jgi:signal transduction histidine kinase/ligand-binding sensor domain-containing protein/DNA-binding response OmpR family regulator
MKFKKPFVVYLTVIFFFLTFCDRNKSEQGNIDYHQQSSVELPKKQYVHPDSILKRTPGLNGKLMPELVFSDMPKQEEFNTIKKVVPGISDLPLSAEEKLSGKSPVKSKKPIVHYLRSDKSSYITTAASNPKKILLPKPLLINNDSVLVFETIAKRAGLTSVQYGDTIYPPLKKYSAKPFRTKALDFEYKDDAIYDICFLGENQRLPNSYIRDISIDKHGVLWIASYTGGLISYDGQFFDQYIEKTGLSDNGIVSMTIDDKERIWMGTARGGLNCYDGNSITQYTTNQGFPSNFILSVLQDSKGRMWFGTAKGLVCLRKDSMEVYTIKQGLATNVIYTLLEDKHGNIWIGTYGKGVQVWNGKNFVSYSKKDGLAGDKILALFEDHRGNIWITTEGSGVSRFDGKSFVNYNVEQGLGNSSILSIIESGNKIWFGTFGNGISCFDGQAFSYYTSMDGLNDDYIRTLFDDGNGNIWIGTDGGGISKLRINGFRHITEKQGLADKLIVSVFQDDNNRMWFGAFEKGLMLSNNIKHDEQLRAFVPISSEQGLANNIVTCIFQDSKRNYWFATYGGGVSKLDYNSFKNNKLKFTNYSTDQGLLSDIVRNVIEDENGDIWFSTKGGATRFDGENLFTLNKKAGLGGNDVLCLFLDRENAIWIGSRGGGVSRLKNDSITTFNIAQGLANNTVWTIAQDKNGILWFGTNGNGLSYYDGKKIVNINTNDGLCNNFVFSLTVDQQNNLWVGTTRGLSKLILKPALGKKNNTNFYKKPQIINYGKLEGLKSLDFYHNSALLDKNGELWFGTTSALTLLDLKSYDNYSFETEIHINEISINDKSLEFTGLEKDKRILTEEGIRFDSIAPFLYYPIGLSLPNNLNHLTFNYSATNWDSPNKIKFQFKLKGLDHDWNPITQEKHADYRNIPPGTYSFVLRSKGISGNWSEELEYPFTIRSPWWMAWWAIIFYVFAGVSLIWLIVIWRVNIIKRQKTVLEKMVVERTKDLDKALALAEKATLAKSQFVARMSHEIRTPLTAILGFTKLLTDITSNLKQRDYLMKIDRSANTMHSLINEILDFSKIESGKMELEFIPFDLEILLNSIIILNHKQLHDKNLELIIYIAPEVPKILIGDSLRLGQVITNLINNAVKFTDSGEVFVDISLKKKFANDEILLQFEVKDSGIGIDESQIFNLFDEFQQADNSITRRYGGSGLGLAICKSLVNKMGGEIWVESKQSVGSTFYFTVKLSGKQSGSELKKTLPGELQNMNVLVCDSNPSTAKLINDYLDVFSLKTETVASRLELVGRLEAKQFDLLLIDHDSCTEGSIDGFIKLLSNLEGNMKTIVLSASEKQINGLGRLNIPFDDYLLKPVLPTAVFEKILNVFDIENTSAADIPNDDRGLEQIRLYLRNKKVLLAEDNEINSELIKELLEKVGASVDLTDNGASAVRKTMDDPYDLILMDLHMPIMDGFYASVQIRKHNSKIPIIAISADVKQTIKARCEESGINDIIAKPIDPDLLYDTILKWTSSKKKSAYKPTTSKRKQSSNYSQLKISGLDVVSGIRRFGGNDDLYFKLLKKFMQGNESICAEIEELIQKSDFDKAHFKIHVLKGDSSNIGADKIYLQTKIVENFILDNNLYESARSLKILRGYLNNLMSGLQTYFISHGTEYVSDQSSLKKLIGDLIKNLQANNPKALDLLDDLNEMHLHNLKTEHINKAVEIGNNEEACNLLRRLLKRI